MQDELVVESGPALSQGERVVDTFVAPSKTFTDVLRSASWWLPFVLIVLVSYGLMFGVSKKVGWEQLVENTIHSNPKQEEKLSTMPPEQVATQKKFMLYSFKYSFVASPIFVGLFVSVIALVFWPTMNFLFGGQASYGRVFCVVMYSWLIMSLKSLVALVLLFAGRSTESFTMDDMVGTNPGYYIDTPGALKTFMTSLDLFSIWYMIVLALGLTIVARTKKNSGYIAVFGWWALIVVIKTAWAAMMS